MVQGTSSRGSTLHAGVQPAPDGNGATVPSGQATLASRPERPQAASPMPSNRAGRVLLVHWQNYPCRDAELQNTHSGAPTWAAAGPCPGRARGTAWAAAPSRAAGAPHHLRGRGAHRGAHCLFWHRHTPTWPVGTPQAVHQAPKPCAKETGKCAAPAGTGQHAANPAPPLPRVHDARLEHISPSPATDEKSVPAMLLTTVVSTVGCCCAAGGSGAPWPAGVWGASKRRRISSRWTRGQPGSEADVWFPQGAGCAPTLDQ